MFLTIKEFKSNFPLLNVLQAIPPPEIIVPDPKIALIENIDNIFFIVFYILKNYFRHNNIILNKIKYKEIFLCIL